MPDNVGDDGADRAVVTIPGFISNGFGRIELDERLPFRPGTLSRSGIWPKLEADVDDADSRVPGMCVGDMFTSNK